MPLNKIETESLGSALNAPTATALATATGSAPSYAARAWVNFNGVGTVAIRASGNVSSITDNGTGDYTVNFATAMIDANYSVAGMCGAAINENYYLYTVTYATGSCRITSIVAATKADVSIIGVSIFR